MSLRTLSPLSPRSLNFRLIASFFSILLLIFSIGNVITIQLAREQLYQQRDAQIAAQRENFRIEIEQAERHLIADLQAQLAIITKAVRGPLQNHVSVVRDVGESAEAQIVRQFADCLRNTETSRIYSCLKVHAHHFSLDSIDLTNHLMIKTSIELLLSREELVAVEVLDWEDQLFAGYALDRDGILHPLRQRFASQRQTLRRLEQLVVEDDYLGRVIFHYHTETIDAQSRRAEESIAQFIEYSDRSAVTATRQITQTRLIEGVIFFVLSLLAISIITLVTIIRPLTQLTRHAEYIAQGDWHVIQACDASVQRHDELGILIRTFNLMLETIHTTHQELKNANTCLEQKVKERTRELEEKNQQLERLSSTDGLTQISNRVKLDEQFREQLQLAQRYDAAFSILLCDVDFFKRINDTYGHQSGDQVLIEMAQLLQQEMRQTDHVGRWGGEEFLVILPETSLTDALALAERLRCTIANHTFPGGPTSVTISAGLSSYQIGDTQETMVERADQALYRAKSEGRNRVLA